MKSPFVSSFQNSNIADFDRARAQALLEMKIRETADVGRARGYVREGKPFEAQVILSKYGGLREESPFDPLVARETAQRTKQLGNLQSQLSQELGFPDINLPQLTLNQLKYLEQNKSYWKNAYDNYKRNYPNSSPSTFFNSAEFKALTSKGLPATEDVIQTVEDMARFMVDELKGAPPAAAAAAAAPGRAPSALSFLAAKPSGRPALTISSSSSSSTASAAAPAPASPTAAGPSAPPMTPVAGPSAPSSSTSTPASIYKPSANAIAGAAYAGLTAEEYRDLDPMIKTRLTNNRKSRVKFNPKMLNI
jgi:hypothetical protein